MVFLKLSSIIQTIVSVLPGAGSYDLFLPSHLGLLGCVFYPPMKYQEGDACFSFHLPHSLLPKEGRIICLIDRVGFWLPLAVFFKLCFWLIRGHESNKGWDLQYLNIENIVNIVSENFYVGLRACTRVLGHRLKHTPCRRSWPNFLNLCVSCCPLTAMDYSRL